jgi:NAD(P)-dependent dehydrogenase (short-subunit alcohol dehydrogenase family)
MARILMTGASSGFGKSVRSYLRERGHFVSTIGNDVGADRLCDFTDFSRPSIADYVGQKVLNEHYTVLINNAGQISLGSIKTQLPYRFEQDLAVNLIAPFTICQSFISAALEMRDVRYRIINTASMAYRLPGRECPGYVASKAGLEALTRALAKELAPDPRFILCNVAPGMVENTGMQRQGDDHLQKVRGLSPVQAHLYQSGLRLSMITHEEICEVYRFAVEDMPWAMSGTTLTLPAGCGI